MNIHIDGLTDRIQLHNGMRETTLYKPEVFEANPPGVLQPGLLLLAQKVNEMHFQKKLYPVGDRYYSIDFLRIF